MHLPRLRITRRHVSRHCRGLTEESSTLNVGDALSRIPNWAKRRKQNRSHQPLSLSASWLRSQYDLTFLQPELKPFPAQRLFCGKDHIKEPRILKLWLWCICQVLCESKEKNSKDGAGTCRRSYKPGDRVVSLWKQGMRRRRRSLQLWTRETWA